MPSAFQRRSREAASLRERIHTLQTELHQIRQKEIHLAMENALLRSQIAQAHEAPCHRKHVEDDKSNCAQETKSSRDEKASEIAGTIATLRTNEARQESQPAKELQISELRGKLALLKEADAALLDGVYEKLKNMNVDLDRPKQSGGQSQQNKIESSVESLTDTSAALAQAYAKLVRLVPSAAATGSGSGS